MNQEIFSDRAVLHFASDSAVVRDDQTHPGLVVGYGQDGKIVELILLNPKKRGNSDQVAVVDDMIRWPTLWILISTKRLGAKLRKVRWVS
jgi:hypothetical protein